MEDVGDGIEGVPMRDGLGEMGTGRKWFRQRTSLTLTLSMVVMEGRRGTTRNSGIMSGPLARGKTTRLGEPMR